MLVAIVEDEACIREDIALELTERGYDVVEADNGLSGLEIIKKHKPDLVLSDVGMPHMNGHEMLRTLCEEVPRFTDTPFIFLSAYADPSSIKEATEMGSCGYLTKPVDYDVLVATVERYCQKK